MRELLKTITLTRKRIVWILLSITAVCLLLLFARFGYAKILQINGSDDCGKTGGAQLQCWNDLLVTVHSQQGAKKSFEMFAALYASEPSFASDCHSFTHTLGQLAYLDYASGIDFEITDELGYCSFGFLHGFVEALMEKEGDYNKVVEFCDYLGIRNGTNSVLKYACIHGIGHGVTDGTDPRAFGSIQKLVEPGIRICRDIGRNDFETKICATGVFDSLARLILAEKHGLEANVTDPYEPCYTQEPKVIKQACYEDFKSLVYSMSDKRFDVALRHVFDLDEDTETKIRALENIVLIHASYHTGTHFADTIATCQNIPEKAFSSACIGAMSQGLIYIGIPNKEYIHALAFCSSSGLTEAERSHCYTVLVEASSIRYVRTTLVQVCDLVPRKYHTERVRDICF